jgi:putative ABC transport system permease protein
MGIRMALGAQKSDVFGLVLAQGLRLTALGVAIGLAGALGVTRALSSMLFGVAPGDPLTFSLVSGLLIGVALVACYVPARAATRVDPMAALRYE